MSVSLETVRNAAALEAIAPEWDALVRGSPRPSPFQLSGWMLAWWRHFGAGSELAVEVARRDGALVAALPLHVRRTAGTRTAAFLGDRYGELSDLLLAPGEQETLGRELVERVDADLIHVFGLPADSRLAGGLASDSPRLVVRAEAPYVDIDRPWDELFASKLSKQRRRWHKKRERQLHEAGSVELHVAREAAELEAALEHGFRIHELRWRGRPDQSGFVTPDGKSFHRDALRSLAQQGVPRIVTLSLDGYPVAYYYYALLGDRAYGVHTGYDPAFARLSAGWLTTVQALQSATSEGARRFEFLGGREPYKLLLADGFAPLHEGFARPRTLAARVYTGAQLARVGARRRLKESATIRRLYYEGLAPLRRVVARRSREATAEP